jgi:hypothetical protein
VPVEQGALGLPLAVIPAVVSSNRDASCSS